ncbi:hypothetical protein ACVBEH_25440, partial [Roseateles sp. GG27B]
LTHTAQYDRYESRQRQLALPRKCFGVRRMTGLQEEFGRPHVRDEVGKDGIEKHGADEKIHRS